jgi:hypothetical protein
MPHEKRKPRTVADVRKFMRDVGSVGVSVMASGEPVATEAQCAAVRVAERLVGGLPSWDGERSGRVTRMAEALLRLQQADAAAQIPSKQKGAQRGRG